jgi:predicted nucleic acid-binding protein
MMVLVDTSIWVNHLRRGKPHLRLLLEEAQVACHPFVIGELACGRLDPREEILTWLSALPAAEFAHHDEVLDLIERRDLAGRGMGLIDAHLVASALISHMPIWTADRRLAEISRAIGIAYPA